jgi:PAS domain S-box-containing protein
MDDGRRTKKELIAELHALRETTKASEERLRLALEGGVDGLWDWDARTGDILYWGKCREIFGCDADEAETRLGEWADRIHPDDRARMMERVKRVLEGKGETYTHGSEHRVQCKDGRYKWIFARGRIVSTTEDGKPLRVMGVFMDITERKEAEEALRESEFKYRALFENGHNAIALMDGGTFTDCNEKTLEMFRCRREQVIGKTPFDFAAAVQPDGRPSRKEIGKRTAAVLSGEPQFFEWRQRRPDGTAFDSEVSLSRVDLCGSPVIQVIIRDITGRKVSEEALRESEAKFRNLAEKSVAGVYLIQDGRLRYVNQRFAETLGYGPSELGGGTRIENVIYPEDRPLVKENLRRRISGELKSLHYEFRLMTKDGETRNAEVYSSRTIYQGRPAVIGTLLDITERKRSDELLKHAEEQYRSIFENAVEGIFQVGPHGEPVAANHALAGMFGCASPQEMIALLAKRGEQACVRREQAAELKRLLDESGSARGFEMELCRKDGGIICVSVNARAIRAGDGSFLRYEGMVEDITKRKKAEEALTRSEAELRALVGSMSDIIMVVDRNGRFIKLLAEPDRLSRPATEVHGRTFKEIFPENVASLFFKGVKRALRVHQTVNIEHSLQIKGKEHWFSTAISPMTHGFAVCVARDITDLKTAEKALQAKSIRLLETNTALKVLLRNMEETRKDVEETIGSNIRMFVMPSIEKLASLKLGSLEKACVDVVVENLKDIASPFLHGLSRFNLTPAEIKVANYIKDGKTTKEIIALLNISKAAIDTHRYNMRRKLGINKEKANLCAYLRSVR